MPVVERHGSAGRRSRANFDVVVICASAGGLSGISTILRGLPPDFVAPVLIVQHFGTRLPELLQRHTLLSMKWAEHGLRLRPRSVYVAPVDQHLSITDDYRCALTGSPKVNACRPSGDVLFWSAADVCRERTLGAVLTGLGRDGAEGARAIHAAGGTMIAQHVTGSRWSSMPDSAIATGAVDFVLPVERIAAALVSLVTVPGIEAIFPPCQT